MGKHDLAMGGLYGAATFAAGYAFTFLLKSGDSSRYVTLASARAPSEPEVWQVVGWVYYLMHNVEMTATVTGDSAARSMRIDPTGGQNIVWEQWLVVVPLVLLAAAGYRIARKHGASTGSAGAKAGALLVVGYLPAIVLGALVSQWYMEIGQFGRTLVVLYGPDVVQAALVAGIFYPAIVGGLGGYAYGSRTGVPTAPPADRPADSPETGQRREGTRATNASDGGQRWEGPRTTNAREASRSREIDDGGNQYATFGSRFVAFTIDTVVASLTFGLYALYWIYRTGRYGDSIGKKVSGIVVVDEGGSRRVGYGTAIVREVIGRTIDALLFVVGGYLWVLIDDRNQAVHDKLASTYVVDADADTAP